MRCGYEVPGKILCQAYLYTYSLLREVHLWSIPLEELSTNSFQCHCYFFYVFNVLKSLSL
jgi:hypothetical protein